MTTRQIPSLTIGLMTALVGVYFLTPDKTQLYFSARDIADGDTWRILTGHFMHADLKHLFWNCLGLAVLGSLIEQHSRIQWLTALVVGIVSVNVLLLSPFSQLEYYCGLSGVLNTLLLVVLWLEWRLSHSWLIAAIAIGSIVKVAVEISIGESLMTNISWPPYAWSHVAGLAGGLIIIWFQKRFALLH
jgi:rhomboid family GlyGly-CTERM serine protease